MTTAGESDGGMRLEDRECLRELKARYFRYVDTKQSDGLLSLFAPDARFDGLSVPASDARAFVTWLSRHFVDVVSVHHGGSSEIVFLGHDDARGVWAMRDHVEFLSARPVAEGSRMGPYGFAGAGHYEEAYRRVDGNWKISEWRLTRLRMDPLEAPSLPAPTLVVGASRSSATTWLAAEAESIFVSPLGLRFQSGQSRFFLTE